MPKKRSASDERKYKSILRSCKLSQGRKKGAAKMCKRYAATAVQRGFGGLGAIPARGMGAQLLSVNLGSVRGWQAGEGPLKSGAIYLAKKGRTAIISDADETDQAPGDGEVLLTINRGDVNKGDDLEQIDYDYFPSEAAARAAARRKGFEGLRGTPAQHARDAGLLMREASAADVRGDRRMQHELAVRASEESLWTGDPDLERKADRFLKASGVSGLPGTPTGLGGCACSDTPSGLGGRRRKRKR